MPPMRPASQIMRDAAKFGGHFHYLALRSVTAVRLTKRGP